MFFVFANIWPCPHRHRHPHLAKAPAKAPAKSRAKKSTATPIRKPAMVAFMTHVKSVAPACARALKTILDARAEVLRAKAEVLRLELELRGPDAAAALERELGDVTSLAPQTAVNEDVATTS
ncbi:hypothetical protein WOLCODRAFT_148702 [Wolfiporia cocos MD-104 SS10]|uniref:Uncharacterized protein n=1 Tax=Wolfiporia cocos (strain MD-104) TaxID=742152 RepID=A0A2H3JP05_WOLCO|nr:hypothetical protein WOLCODRAFT_148702 [Wolfiporia cocos MD-104 SS10]